jgi:hypothetical protein
MWVWIIVIGLIYIIAIISSILNHPKVRGIIGEKRVLKQLERLPKEHYRLLNDLMLKAKIGTSQIDHIAISPHGIFVIETKNYKGWIYGDEDSEYWTQTIYRYKIKFRNPIKQNWGHIYTLKEALPEYQHIPYYSVIVFAGNARLKNVNTKSDVIYADKLFETIMNYKGNRQLTNQDMEKIFNTLREFSIKDKELKNQHVKRIRWNVKIREMKEHILICPKCGGHLIKRDGRYGEFYGCENFPKCRYKMGSIKRKDNQGQEVGGVNWNKKALAIAIRNNKPQSRFTHLSERLKS